MCNFVRLHFSNVSAGPACLNKSAIYEIRRASTRLASTASAIAQLISTCVSPGHRDNAASK
jgi:hypothetical protein